jgi:DNA helicase-2/ATP-dependent DNA helicase PcrA
MQELQEGEDRDAVTLITLHNTKGLEFERVIITGMEEGLFPRSDKTDEELEEERRLFYVGITRAKDELYFTNCVVRRVWGYKQYLPVSPLLLEIAHLDLEIQGKPPHLFSLARNTEFNASKKMLSKNSSSDESFDNFFLEEEQKTVLAEDKKTNSNDWSRGQKIFHDDFGYGAIFDVKETSGEITISIQFENGQIKKILPKYAGHKIMAVKD